MRGNPVTAPTPLRQPITDKMNIEGLDYNTQRRPLTLPEYGREILAMVDVAISLPTAEERLQCARTIVKQMEMKVPGLRSHSNYRQTLWDHLYRLSEGRLDIEWPYDVSGAEGILQRPDPMPMPTTRMHTRHYGRMLEETFDVLKTMPEGRERDELARQTANQMKRCLITWGHGNTDNERVAADLADATDGKIQIDLRHFTFDKMAAPAPQSTGKKKKKKK